MLTGAIDALRAQRAKFARDVEYVKETAIDDMVDERMEVAESQYFGETAEELEEAADYVKRLKVDDIEAMESAEVERILNAEDDLSFEEMVALDQMDF